ncbi:unnamed protein product, partial [Mesorhabditis belari]|uniref:Uncharacterized protein n=1 Tax=Mesorhabditis belari TaxID=2138241 RepID=A0AAF3FC57_9BILA
MFSDSLGWGRPPEMRLKLWTVIYILSILLQYGKAQVISPVKAIISNSVTPSAPLNPPCWERPIGCAIWCPNGYRRSPLSTCLCSCLASPCATHQCSDREFCVVQYGRPKCVYQDEQGKPKKEKPRAECPRLINGLCALKCETDKDCNGRLICCHNGCGRECVAPMESPFHAAAPIPQSFPIIPSARPLPPGRIGQPLIGFESELTYLQRDNVFKALHLNIHNVLPEAAKGILDVEVHEESTRGNRPPLFGPKLIKKLEERGGSDLVSKLKRLRTPAKDTRGASSGQRRIEGGPASKRLRADRQERQPAPRTTYESRASGRGSKPTQLLEPHIEKSREIPVQTVFAKPFPVRNSSEKKSPSDVPPGECPSETTLSSECPRFSQFLPSRSIHSFSISSCSRDADCPANFRCCATSLCGNLCTAPTKTTGCLHLLAAVLRLPSKRLANDFLPECTRSGDFEKVQCDDLSTCWCADSQNGAEVPGTRRQKSLKSPLICLSPRSCEISCINKCPHGHKMTASGCPVKNCECKNPCDGIRCPLSWESCQLVEPDCASPPCLPVPRCLINPCPEDQPMTLPNGVTGLCTQSTQCGDAHFCHQIGYNGLGFCCPGAARGVREGNCPARQPKTRENCRQECMVDTDCRAGKCCFDGCALRCVSMSFLPHPVSPMNPVRSLTTTLSTPIKPGFSPGSVFRHNKELYTRNVGSCALVEPSNSTSCPSTCLSDSSCEGVKLCCETECGSRCQYPDSASPCVHRWLTSSLYSLRSVLQCTSEGFFERKQCDDDGCFCVDRLTGVEQAGTRVTHHKTPTCLPDLSECQLPVCRAECPFGFALSSNGCPTCVCVDPCQQVKCPQGSFCQLSAVKCREVDTECSKQPRCIANACPQGDPFATSAGFIQSCSLVTDCPRHFWCHKFGISTGGICCPGPPPNIKAGACPPTFPIINIQENEICKKQCLTDEHCAPMHKCCYNGCGTSCTQAAASFSEVELESSFQLEKPGQCPVEVHEAKNCPSMAIDLCLSDSSCPGVQKCCSDGCRRHSESGSPADRTIKRCSMRTW